MRSLFWRGGRVVECGSLENYFVARQRGFESLSLRHKYQIFKILFVILIN